MRMAMFKTLSSIVPRSYKKKAEVLLNYAGVDEDVDVWLGKRMFFSLLFGLAGLSIPHLLLLGGVISADQYAQPNSEYYYSALAGVASFFIVSVVFYFHVHYVIDERRKRVEAILPDFLLLIAANLRAGMTPIAAFVESSRPEFGPLEDEIMVVASRSLGTESFASIFGRLNDRIDSRVLGRIVGLFTTGMVSGGHLAKLLETSAMDIRETQELRQELESSTRMYIIFVLFLVLVGVPLLLSISIQFLVKLNALKSQISNVSFGEFGSTLLMVQGTLEPAFVENMTYVILIGTTFFVSILIGVINEGKLMYGLRYFIPLAVIGVVDFIVFRGVVQGILAALA